MRKLSKVWIRKDTGNEYHLVNVQKAAYGSHEMVTLAPSESADLVVTRSTINLYEDFQPVNEESNEESK